VTSQLLIPGRNYGFRIVIDLVKRNQYCKKSYSIAMMITGFALVARKKTGALLNCAGNAVEPVNEVEKEAKGTSDQFMNERVVPKMTNFCVVKLSNSPAIACVPRLELDHFESQLDSPRINQRFLR